MSLVNFNTQTKVFLTALVLFSVVFNTVYKPQKKKKEKLQSSLQKLKNKEFKLKTQIQDLKIDDSVLVKENKALNHLEMSLKKLEGQLPQQDKLPDLLREILKQSEGYMISFNLIKPLKKEPESEYQQFKMEMQFSVTYKNLIKYLYRLEKSFPFIGISQLNIDMNDDVDKEEKINRENLNVSVVLSTLLVEESKSTIDFKKLATSLSMTSQQADRDPFVSKFMPKIKIEKEEETEYKLSGIISRGKYPTVIINNEVYKLGDWVGESQIQTITSNKVVLINGKTTNTLVINKEDDLLK